MAGWQRHGHCWLHRGHARDVAVRQLLTEALQDNASCRGSSKRLNTVMACAAMSLAIVILAIAAAMGRDVALAMAGVATPLAGMCGYNYRKPEPTNSSTD